MSMGFGLMPPHVLLSEAQAKRELKMLGISKEDLPLISYSDAAVRHLVDQGAKISVGDVIKITRRSMTVGEAYYYRQVVV